MRKLVCVFALLTALAAACATPTPPPATTSPSPASTEQKALAQRIGKICALPDAQREVELEKLKRESGMVLYCGNKN